MVRPAKVRGVAIKGRTRLEIVSSSSSLYWQEDRVVNLSENLHPGGSPSIKMIPDSPESKVEEYSNHVLREHEQLLPVGCCHHLLSQRSVWW